MDVVTLELAEQFAYDIFAVALHLVGLAHNVRIAFYGEVSDGAESVFAEDDALEEGHHLLHGEVVGVLRQFMQQVQVLTQYQRRGRLEYLIDQQINLRLLEDMGHLIEQRVQ